MTIMFGIEIVIIVEANIWSMIYTIFWDSFNFKWHSVDGDTVYGLFVTRPAAQSMNWNIFERFTFEIEA